MEEIERQACSRSPEGTLSEAELNITIAILRAIESRFLQENLTNLKAPSANNTLVTIGSLTAVDGDRANLPSGTSGSIVRVHPKVPRHVSESLGIPTPDSRHLASFLLVAEEFGQNEERTMAIADVLKRYSVTSTFDEYLANADDCRTASKIEWILDDQPSARYDGLTKKLLSDNMKQFQHIPSLFCYNDGG